MQVQQTSKNLGNKFKKNTPTVCGIFCGKTKLDKTNCTKTFAQNAKGVWSPLCTILRSLFLADGHLMFSNGAFGANI